jgi:PPIC-type PPIASE domain
MAISGKVGALSAKDLEAELVMLSKDKPFVDEVLKGQKVKDGRGWDKDFVATVMQQHLFDDIIKQEAVDRKIAPAPMSDKIKKSALANLGGDPNDPANPASVSAQGALDGFSAAYRDQLYLTQRYIEPLVTGVEDKFAKPYFDKNPGEFATACVTHLLVDDEAVAKKSRERIVAGETFAKVAKEVSKDTGSAANGGELPCTTLSTYVAEFSAAAAKLKIDEISQPVKSQFGFHVLKVTKREPAKWDDKTKLVVRGKFNEKAIAEIRASIAKRVKGAAIVVNPKYGVLDTTEDIPVIKPKGTPITVKSKAPASSIPAGAPAPAPAQ